MTTLSGTTVKMNRKRLKLTQDQLAKKLGCSEMFISSIERGKSLIPGASLKKIAKILNIPTSAFIDEYLKDRIEKIMKELK